MLFFIRVTVVMVSLNSNKPLTKTLSITIFYWGIFEIDICYLLPFLYLMHLKANGRYLNHLPYDSSKLTFYFQSKTHLQINNINLKCMDTEGIFYLLIYFTLAFPVVCLQIENAVVRLIMVSYLLGNKSHFP